MAPAPRVNVEDCVAMVHATSAVLVGILAVKVALAIARKLCGSNEQEDEAPAISLPSKAPMIVEERTKRKNSKERSRTSSRNHRLRGDKTLMVTGEDLQASLYSRKKMKKRLRWFGSPKVVSIQLRRTDDEMTPRKEKKENAVEEKEKKPTTIDMIGPVKETKKGAHLQPSEVIISFSDMEVSSEGSKSLVTPAPSGSKNKAKEKREDLLESRPSSFRSETYPELNSRQTFTCGQRRVTEKFISMSGNERFNREANKGSHSRKKKPASFENPLTQRFCGDSGSWEEIRTSPVQSEINQEPLFPHTSAWGQRRMGTVFINIDDEALPDAEISNTSSRLLRKKSGNGNSSRLSDSRKSSDDGQ